jgi:outer membrane lipoprotein SlyB
MFLTVAGLSNSLNTIIGSQRAQVAADAGALSCAIYGQDAVEQIVTKNQAELISVIATTSQCQVVVQFRGISRDAFAVTSNDGHLPTLQR